MTTPKTNEEIITLLALKKELKQVPFRSTKYYSLLGKISRIGTAPWNKERVRGVSKPVEVKASHHRAKK